MLKSLELVGFKSFAEKTRFDFGPGVTAVVGPNGSGKSNVVDAIRWILGEQSPKSLRGDAMADVIFNGSSSRRSLGMAEVRITLDNSQQLLGMEQCEVQLARRVYRSGEGEYLINGQPARLKDIKTLMLGSGLGADAYSIIEQGRVDVLLQASPRERRAIFEEAAGISRFKARKIETLRKLERTEQNLLRVEDIKEELATRLSSVRHQAARARQFESYQNRLKELRVGAGRSEFSALRQELDRQDSAREEIQSAHSLEAGRVKQLESRLSSIDESMESVTARIHDAESDLASNREQVITQRAVLLHERELRKNLDSAMARHRRRWEELRREVSDHLTAVAQAKSQWAEAEQTARSRQDEVAAAETKLEKTLKSLREAQLTTQGRRAELQNTMEASARERDRILTLKATAENRFQQKQTMERQVTQAAETIAQLDIALEDLSAEQSQHDAHLAALRDHLDELRRQREEARQDIELANQQLGYCREQRSGITSRIQLLEGLERTSEGLGAGVREVLERAADPEPGPWKAIHGMVADMIVAPRAYAPLIDLALGDRAQHCIVVEEEGLHTALENLHAPLAGRVSFFKLSTGSHDVSDSDLLQIRSHSGFEAVAAELVTCVQNELTGLPGQLLGRTFIVQDLRAARELAQSTTGCRFLTKNGELLEPDGTLTVGSFSPDVGFVSRKSELRELSTQAGSLDHEIESLESELASRRNTLSLLDLRNEEARTALEDRMGEAAHLSSSLYQHRERQTGLSQEIDSCRHQLEEIADDLTRLQGEIDRTADLHSTTEGQIAALQQHLEDDEATISVLEDTHRQEQQVLTNAKVACAEARTRMETADQHLSGIEATNAVRTEAGSRLQEDIQSTSAALEKCDTALLSASQTLALACSQKDAAEIRIRGLVQDRESNIHARAECLLSIQAAREQTESLRQELHAQDLRVAELQHRRAELINRLREEHGIDLESFHEGQSEENVAEIEPTSAPREIEDLKRKIARLGGVNMEALDELKELEARAAELQAQCDDLTEAKQSLDTIIGKINNDSRKLFMDTFTAVKSHYHDLFRKLFGGGAADIILEDENDVLESGVEIVARPPGKELSSISLLSGGEKTLAAVALLLAIFRSKPSPFCILDEVDAALDEANIARYTTVLRDFLDQSQFIIVTHSKKTMAAADVLYGITMQESGVSRQVAIKFEDWAEEETEEIPPRQSSQLAENAA